MFIKKMLVRLTFVFGFFVTISSSYADTVLYGVDIFRGTDPVTPALTTGGHTVTTVTNDWSEFNTQLTTGSWDLIILLFQGNDSDLLDKTALSNYINGGGRVIFTSYERNNTDATFFEASYTGNTNAASGTFDASFNVTNPVAFTHPVWATYAMGLTATGGAYSVCTANPSNESCLVIGNQGRTALLGFTADSLPLVDGTQIFEVLIDSLLNAVDYTPEVIGNPTNISGTGCPDASSIISTDGYTIGSNMLTFSMHDVGKSNGVVANSGETWKSDCNFTLPITIPAGQNLEKITLDWSGVSEGDTTKFRRKYLINGESYGPWKNKKFNYGTSTEFALTDNLLFMTPGSTKVLAVDDGCGEETTLNLRVKTKLVAVYGHSYISINSLLADAETNGFIPYVTVNAVPCIELD